jgi:FtsZ-binding cell division protein ZapB
MATTVKEIDPLDHLEERIQKAVVLVHRLREEKEAAAKAAAEDREMAAMEREDAAKTAASEKLAAEKVADALRVDLEEAQNTNTRLTADIEAMRQERQQVRTRLEKLLGHIDQLGAA